MSRTLTKTRYMNGLQCPKLFWYAYNKKEDFPPLDLATKAIFGQGNAVGIAAQKLFPGGIKIPRNPSPRKHTLQSIQALKNRKPLFEAGFMFEDVYALADVLNPVGKDSWDLVEVKSSTQVKDEYYDDVVFQKYIYEGIGIKINRCILMYINNDYIRKGELNPNELFSQEDITEAVNELGHNIKNKVNELLKIINEKEPNVQIGPHCDDPYACRLKNICWDFLPKKDSIFELSRGKKTSFNLLKKDIVEIVKIPSKTKLTANQSKQVEAHKTGNPIINFEAINKMIKSLKYPLYFLDFETISPAIPLFNSSKPYGRIPFQYSMFVISEEGRNPEHYSFLWKNRTDPRLAFIKSLKKNLGNSGSIIAYNTTFEIGVLKDMCEVISGYNKWFGNTKSRFVDLYIPFKKFDYYHPDQQGSASIKKVLPVLTGKGYEELEYSSGEIASLEYFRVTHKESVSDSVREKIYADLEKYCDLDTYGMVDLLSALKKLIKE